MKPMCCGVTGEAVGNAPSLKEATAQLVAGIEKLKSTIAKLSAVESVEREVVAAYLTPAAPGKKAELIKVVREGPKKDERVFALPTPYYEQADNVPDTDEQTFVWIKSNSPLTRLKMELHLQMRIADDRHASPRAREEARRRAKELVAKIDAMRAAIRAGRLNPDGTPVEPL